MIGLKANLSPYGRLYFALVSTRTGEERTAHLNLDEYLSIECEWRGVEGSSRDVGVDKVGCSDGV